MDDEQERIVKKPQKAPKTPEFDTDLDDLDDEQEPIVKQFQKASKTSECSSTEDEQEPTVKQPQKAPKTPGSVDTDPDDSDNEQGPAANYQRYMVMYNTKDEQEPAIKNLQKASTITKFVDTGPSAEDEQKPVVKKLQKASKIHDEDPQEISPVHKESARPAKKLPAASCTHILTSGISKGNQCWFKASDKTGKFCHHHKQT